MIAAIMDTYAIPLAALIISMATLVYGSLGSKQKSESDLVVQLYTRIDDLEGQVETLTGNNKELTKKVDDLQGDNLNLMRRLLNLENGGGKK